MFAMCIAGLGEDRDSLAAFLFTWPDGDTSQAAIKLPKVCHAHQKWSVALCSASMHLTHAI